MTRWLCLGLAALLLCSACISDDVSALRYHDVSGVAATVHILDSPETVGEYVPAVLHVHAGATVAFVNASGDYHTVTFIASPADAPSSVGIPPGGTFETTLRTPGIYAYRCLYHIGMVGQIVVSP